MNNVDKMYNEVFYVNEVDKPYNFRIDELPTSHDCLRYVISRTNQHNRTGQHKVVVHDLAELVKDTSWLSAPLASTPVKIKPSGEILGAKICQRGNPRPLWPSPVIFEHHP